MRVEDAAFASAGAFVDSALHFENLVACLNQSLLEAIDFLRRLGVGQLPFGNRRTGSANDQNSPAAHAGGNRDTAKNPFALVQRLWHGPFLAKAGAVEKQFLGVQGHGAAKGFEDFLRLKFNKG